MTLPQSYEDIFRRFDAADGKWIATWNWAAFVFGIFWYAYRGMWVKAIIYFFALLIVGAVTAGILVPFAWIAMGVIANYDLYLLNRKGTQLWDGGSVAASSLAAVSPLTPHTSSVAHTRLSALENARNQGIISDAEYAEKRQQLEQDAEREKKLSALEEMRRAGILSPVDYEAKKRDIMFEGHAAVVGSPA